jgi:hypothetical protein
MLFIATRGGAYLQEKIALIAAEISYSLIRKLENNFLNFKIA